MTSFCNNSEETEKVMQSPLSTTCKAFTSCIQQPFPQTPESVAGPREWVPWQEAKPWREGATVMKKNHISLAKNETGAQVVSITSNYLP